MEVNKPSNRVKRVKTGLHIDFNVTLAGVVNRTGYYTPQGLFVSFMVKESRASASVFMPHPFSSVTHSKRQRTPNSVVVWPLVHPRCCLHPRSPSAKILRCLLE